VKFGAVLTILAFLFAGIALAEDVDRVTLSIGNLQKVCTATDSEAKAACSAFILGVSQGIALGMAIADGKTVFNGRLCIPARTKTATIEMLVKDSIDRGLALHPEDREGEAAGLVGAILIKKFPCSKPN
jgi:hypothetical protein